MSRAQVNRAQANRAPASHARVSRAQAAADVATRLQLLELEAAVQRATLDATFAELGRRRVLVVGSALGSGIVRLLSVPRIRWLLLASVLARLKRARGRRHP